jgi:uncharacterized protein YbjT (DUF2867 family)
MIAITGATGNIGSKIALDLLSRREKVRCIARGAKKLERLAGKEAETTAVDLLDTGAMTKAFSGAEAVFVMIPPNYGAPDYGAYQKAAGESMVEAIDKAGVKFVVNLSSQGAHLPDKTGPIKGLHDQEKRLEKLRGVHALHMRPAYFMENLLTNIDMIREQNMLGGALRADMRIPMIATQDIAKFAAERLSQKDFSGIAVKDLLGQRDLSMNETTAILSEKIGQPGLKYVQFTYEDTRSALLSMGLSDDVAGLFIEMIRAFNDGLIKPLRTPENTTETPFEEFAALFAKILSGE